MDSRGVGTAAGKRSNPQVTVYNGHGADGLDALLADSSIDAIAFVLPITAQPDLIIKALTAGKHVISEKPVGKDVATAKALIETYEKEFKPKGLIWRVAESEFSTAEPALIQTTTTTRRFAARAR